MATLWVYLPKYSITCLGPPKGLFAYTTQFLEKSLSVKLWSLIPLALNKATNFARNTLLIAFTEKRYLSVRTFMLQEFGGLKHTPDLFPTQDHRKFLDSWNGGKVEVAVGQTFGLQQKAESVNGMFEVRLGRCFGALLELEKVIFDLLRVQLGG